MDSREVKKLTDAVVDIRRSLDEINKTGKTNSKIMSELSKEIARNESIRATTKTIPVELDWVEPSVMGKLSFTYNGDGSFTIKLVVDELDALDVKQIFKNTPPEIIDAKMDDAVDDWNLNDLG